MSYVNLTENQDIKRVGLNLNQVIVEFWKLKLASAGTAELSRFTATELRQYVQKHNFGTAPASADRILRNLRAAKKVNYAVVNRSKSLYEAIPLETAQ